MRRQASTRSRETVVVGVAATAVVVTAISGLLGPVANLVTVGVALLAIIAVTWWGTR